MMTTKRIVSESSLLRVEPALRSRGVFSSRLADVAQDHGISILANVRFLNWCPAGAQHVTIARKADLG